MREETQKLLVVGHIREIQYLEWLGNLAMVKKTNGKWRMFVDFTDLNKACPNDSYSLPSIDSLIDSALRLWSIKIFGCFFSTTKFTCIQGMRVR